MHFSYLDRLRHPTGGIYHSDPHFNSPMGICIQFECRLCKSESDLEYDKLRTLCLEKLGTLSTLSNFKELLLQQAKKALDQQNSDLENCKQQLRNLAKSYNADKELKEVAVFKAKQLLDQRKCFIENLKDKLDIAKQRSHNKDALLQCEKDVITEYNLFRKNLPAYGIKNELIQELRQKDKQFCLIIGETGSGKTTQTPQFLYQKFQFSLEERVICVQPRKIAAISLAKRVAEELGVKLGEEVGFQVGFGKPSHVFSSKDDDNVDASYGPKTKILFVTENVLLKKMIADVKGSGEDSSEFQDVKAILLDEIHERSLLSDLIFGTLKTKFTQKHSHIKIFLASATVDTEKFANYFDNCRVIRIEGRTYPVETIYRPVVDDDYIVGTLDVLKEIVRAKAKDRVKYDGHIIVFLTSVSEMKQLKQSIEDTFGERFCDEYVIHLLHGSLTSEKQQLVVDPSEKTKIILATKIAESSVTVNGVKIVIDSGFDKDAFYDAAKGITNLKTGLINKASAQQRQGRAGRTAPGLCYRLYSEETFRNFGTSKIPEICKMNLESAILKIIDSGLDPWTFPFFEHPGHNQITNTIRALTILGALDEMGRITIEGNIMMNMSTEPRVTKILIQASQRGCIKEAIWAIVVEEYERNLLVMPEDEKERRKLRNQKIISDSEFKSDYLDYLAVYEKCRQAAEYRDSEWFEENKINFKTFKKIERRIEELNRDIYALTKKSRNVYNYLVGQKELSTGPVEERLLKSVLASCVLNIGKFTGSREYGYIDLANGFKFHIHCSSSLMKYFPHINEIHDYFLIYGRMKREDRNLAQGVSLIPAQWIEDSTIIKTTAKNEILTNMKKNYTFDVKSFELPYWAIKKFNMMFRERFGNLRVEGSQKSSYEMDLTPVPEENLVVLVYSRGIDADKLLNGLKNELRKELEKDYKTCNPKDTNYSAVFRDGLGITELLLPQEYISVSYSIAKEGLSREQVLKALYLNEKEVLLTVYNKEYSTSGTISFVTKQKAKEFIDRNDYYGNPYTLKSVPLKYHIKNSWRRNYKVLAGYSTWRSKCEAKATFYSGSEAAAAMQTLQNARIDDSFVNVNSSRKNPHFVFIKNLSPTTGKKDLENHLRGYYGFVSVMVHSYKPEEYPPGPPEEEKVIDFVESRYGERAREYFNPDSIQQKGLWVNFKLTMLTRDSAEEFKNEYDGVAGILSTQKLSVKVEETLYLTINKKVLEVMMPLIDSTINALHRANDVKIFFRNLETSKFDLITVIGSNYQVNHGVVDTFKNLCNGEELKVISHQDRLKLFHKQTISFCEKLEEDYRKKKHPICINFDYLNKKVTLHSPFRNTISEVITHIHEALKILFVTIDVRQYSIKKIKSYVETITQGLLQSKASDKSVSLDYMKKEVLLTGNSAFINSFKEEIQKFKRSPLKPDEEPCPTCYEALPKDYCLSFKCLHKLCQECFKQSVLASADKQQAACHCGETFLLQDIYEAMSEEDLEPVITSRIQLYLRTSTDYKNCPTPECKCVYHVSESVYECQGCEEDYCLRTPGQHHRIHPGRMCGEGLGKVEGLSGTMITPCCKKQWIKDPGCLHIACPCGKHFCDKCMSVFNTSGETYAHMRGVHGGYF